MAYLDFVKSGNSTYVYVAEYSTAVPGKKEKRIYSLGDLMSAYKRLEYWRRDHKKIPNVIKMRDHKSINKWMDMVKNRGAF